MLCVVLRNYFTIERWPYGYSCIIINDVYGTVKYECQLCIDVQGDGHG